MSVWDVSMLDVLRTALAHITLGQAIAVWALATITVGLLAYGWSRR